MVTYTGSRRPWATLAILAVATVLLWLAWQRLEASVATPDVGGGVPTAGDSAAELRGASVERGGLESSVDSTPCCLSSLCSRAPLGGPLPF